jgi:hypothetical protein
VYFKGMVADDGDYEMVMTRIQDYQAALEALLRVTREHASTEPSAGSLRAALRVFDEAVKRQAPKPKASTKGPAKPA